MKAWILNLSIKIKILIIICIILLLVFSSLFFIRIRNIKISGNSWYSEEDIEKLIFPNDVSKLSIVVLTKKILNKKKTIPFVEKYDINFNNPFKIELIIYEKSMVASVEYMSSYMYFDKDGVVVESVNKRLEGIPVIKNLEIGDIILYKKLPVKDPDIFNEILNITQMLKVKSINADYIEYNNDKTINLLIGDIKVYLGKISNIDTGISELADILPKLDGLKGELYLDNLENINSKGIYTFKKK